jgi:hypothetical protein
MSKEIEKNTCRFCESTYKVIYNYEESSGSPRFCCFCGEESYDEEEDTTKDDEEE